jgi:hypothetical protein
MVFAYLSSLSTRETFRSHLDVEPEAEGQKNIPCPGVARDEFLAMRSLEEFVGQALPLATVFRRQAERPPYNLRANAVVAAIRREEVDGSGEKLRVGS